MTAPADATGPDLAAWCERTAAEYAEMEHHGMDLLGGDARDAALVEWTVRVLGNASLRESREVVRVLAERHGLLDEVERLRELGRAARRAVNDDGGKDPWDALVAAVDALDADQPDATPLDPDDREALARELIADLRQPVAGTTPAQIVDHGPVRPPYGSPERAARAAAEGGDPR